MLTILLLTTCVSYSEGKPPPYININEKYSVCENDNPFSPCRCQTLMTQQAVPIQDGSGGTKHVFIEYEEYACHKSVDMDKVVNNRFRCTQLEDLKTVSKDIDENPVRVSIKYKAGCELRCLDKNCAKYNVVHMKRRNIYV